MTQLKYLYILVNVKNKIMGRSVDGFNLIFISFIKYIYIYIIAIVLLVYFFKYFFKFNKK